MHSNNFISYDTPDHRSAAAHGVFDSKLGATKDQECQTCKQNFKDCPGHFGYIPVSYIEACHRKHKLIQYFKLTLPIFHTGYITHTYNLLQMICKTCSRVLLKDRVDENGNIVKDPNVPNSREYFRNDSSLYLGTVSWNFNPI